MTDDPPATVYRAALCGLACRCPRCGKGRLYAGFLTLRPSCESCGLDYAFIDAGDGPAIFIIMEPRVPAERIPRSISVRAA